MSQAIIRLYDSAENAAGAVKQLKFEGLTEETFTLIAPGTPADKVVALLLAKWVLKSKASLAAAEVQRGRWLVCVLAPFSMGYVADEALSRNKPVESSVDEAADRGAPWDEAAPFSSALGIPAVINSTGLHTSLGIPTLSSPGWSLSSFLGLPLVTRSSSARLSPHLAHFSLSSKLGLPLLKGAIARR